MTLELSLGGDAFQHERMVLPLLGERAGVRARVLFDCILTAKLILFEKPGINS